MVELEFSCILAARIIKVPQPSLCCSSHIYSGTSNEKFRGSMWVEENGEYRNKIHEELKNISS